MSITRRTAHTRVVFWPDQQRRTLPEGIVASRFRRGFWRTKKPPITEALVIQLAAPPTSREFRFFRSARTNPLDQSAFSYCDFRRKSLAQSSRRREDRSAMRRFARSNDYGRAFVAALVSLGFFWALALSASPQLHQRVHKDANRVEHNCVATMIASGSYNHAAHPALVSIPTPTVQFSKVPALTPQWVQSPFLGACIFEHAPPARPGTQLSRVLAER
jgi:hypothetical protein